MFHYPNDHRAESTTRNATEQWARLEAKSEAMVEDVLAASGAATEELPDNGVLRRWRLAAMTILGVMALLLAVAIALSPIPPPDARDASAHVTTEDWPSRKGYDIPRYWGPFRP